MAFIDEVKKVFKIPKDHEPRVLLLGATDQKNFESIWENRGIEEGVTSTMDENASKAGMRYSPVFILILEGKGHYDAEIVLPLQAWAAGLSVTDSVLNTMNTQRITDWCAGFMETFTDHNTVSAVDITTGALVFGDERNTGFKLDNIINSLRPKREKSELLADAMDIGSVDDILAGQLTSEEIKERREKKSPEAKEERVAMPRTEISEVTEKTDVMNRELMMKMAEEEARVTQQDIVDKYGFKALEDLLAKTGQPLLVTKPKTKKV